MGAVEKKIERVRDGNSLVACSGGCCTPTRGWRSGVGSGDGRRKLIGRSLYNVIAANVEKVKGELIQLRTVYLYDANLERDLFSKSGVDG